MTNCIIVCSTRYQMFVVVHQCFKNTLTKHRKELYRELRTCINPHISSFSRSKCHPFKCHSHEKYWKKSFAAIYNGSIFDARCIHLNDNRSNKLDDAEPKKEVKLSLIQKFKRMYKDYWYVLAPVHIITSAFWFGSFYYAAASGINVPELLESFGAPDSWIESIKNSKAGNAVIAYTLYKIATPIRYTVSIGGTTISINYLKKWGWIKPVPNKEEIKRIYQEQKGAFKDLTSAYQDKLQMKKDDLIKKKDLIKEHYVEARDGLQKSVIESKKDFKKGVKDFSSEIKQLGTSFKKSIRNAIDKKADYVAKPIIEKENANNTINNNKNKNSNNFNKTKKKFD